MTSMHRMLVSGRVQQVGYRDHVVRQARSLGVTGWVRNLSDGRVEIMAGGEPDAIASLIEACHNGPRIARITDVAVTDSDEQPVKGFTKRFTV